jgi:hypothetical protein
MKKRKRKGRKYERKRRTRKEKGKKEIEGEIYVKYTLKRDKRNKNRKGV